MSMFAVPLKRPGFAISITLLVIVASTLPSITRTSQLLISTPLRLMFGPIDSLLPGVSVAGGRACADSAGTRGLGGGDAAGGARGGVAGGRRLGRCRAGAERRRRARGKLRVLGIGQSVVAIEIQHQVLRSARGRGADHAMTAS